MVCVHDREKIEKTAKPREGRKERRKKNKTMYFTTQITSLLVLRYLNFQLSLRVIPICK